MKNKDAISSDSSFYIGFADDLNGRDWLYSFLDLYSFYFGKRILTELSTLQADNRFLSSTNKVEVDYYELVKPYFGRNPKHINDGEYEAIGIAHYLDVKRCLCYLIIDENTARNFVIRHFPYLANKLVGSIGFIRDCCNEDKKINILCAIEILTAIKEEINRGKRVFGMTQKDYERIVAPIIEKMVGSCEK